MPTVLNANTSANTASSVGMASFAVDIVVSFRMKRYRSGMESDDTAAALASVNDKRASRLRNTRQN
jgi:hypothetical protein